MSIEREEAQPGGKPLRVLILNYEYPPLGGGAANATRELVREYQKTGTITLDVVTSAHDNRKRKEILDTRATLHFVPVGLKTDSLHYQTPYNILRYSWGGLWAATSLLRKERYDVIHAFFGLPSGFMALLLRIIFKTPYIVSLRGSDVPGYSERFQKFYPLLKPLIKYIWHRAGAVITNSHGLKQLALQTAPSQNIFVIPNGVDTERFFPKVEEENHNEELIITTGATRLTERKGIRYLLAALRDLSNNTPMMKVEIMGEGNEKETLKRLVAEYGLQHQVRFLGRIPREETPLYYRRADVFILPSFNEGMSNALLEAMASGLPAVVTDTGGSKELVEEGVNGLYIAMKSSESIVTALSTLARDPELRKKFGAESRRRALQMSWASVAKQYQQYYREIRQPKG